jgi:hypothetical protein
MSFNQQPPSHGVDPTDIYQPMHYPIPYYPAQELALDFQAVDKSFQDDINMAMTGPPQLLVQDDVNNSNVYAAVYSGVPVFEMMCRTVAVMRRRADSFLNATQILKVAGTTCLILGIEKGPRTKILEKEVQNGNHEKVQVRVTDSGWLWKISRDLDSL